MANEDDKPQKPPTGSQPQVRTGTRVGATGPQPMVAPAAVAPPAGQGDPYLGTQVAGRYKILSKLGEGGMGVVYLAEHVFIEKKVAIKILSEDFARKADLVARFMQEAKAASKIGHENIIDITDFGETASGSVFFVMEYLDGADLANTIRAVGSLPLGRVRYIFNQICRGLGAAHGKGIIHRDLKPENIYLVTREGSQDFVKILDFGIAKISSVDEGGSRLTRTGMIFGTPEYMSPEQARGDRPDHRVDIYAAGCILYEMLTGDVPFHAETFMGVLTKHMFEEPEPPTRRAPQLSIPPAVEAVVLKALAKDRDQRYQTMKELALALEDAVGGDPAAAWGSETSSVAVMYQREPSKPFKVPVGSSPTHVTPPPSISTPIEKKGRGLIAALAGVVVVGGVAAVIALKKPAEPPPKPVEAPKAALPVETPKAAVPVEPKPVAVVPQEPAQPVKVPDSEIDISSMPSQAEIFRGAERLGVTPAKLTLAPTTQPFEVVIKKKGFKEHKLRISPDRSREYVVELPSAAAAARPHTSSRPLPAPPPPVEKAPEAKPPTQPAGKLRDLKDPFAN